ncbi:Mite allergen Der p 3 [Beauveria bassiana]|nr:Mite allergen Der p 3 [Beauveria bassiana]KAH8721388.1 Mite allergen Der p 3 [Beauveria bassiana]
MESSTSNSNTGGVDANIASSKQHPDYELYAKDGGYAVNDIAILKLSTAIEKSENIDYATLPANGSDPEANSIAVAAGWGAQTSIDAFAHDKLSKVDILVHTRQDCVNLMQAAVARDTIVCAGGGGKNICDRDSGGPLIDQKTGQLIGVTSFVAGTAEEGECTLPAVYTRVGSYIDFIGENLEGLNSSRPKEQTVVKGSYSRDKALTKTIALSSNTKGDKAETPNPEKEPESTALAVSNTTIPPATQNPEHCDECREGDPDNFDGCVEEGQEAFEACRSDPNFTSQTMTKANEYSTQSSKSEV